jgi:5-methyltetrahydropteroyltriglutamate--homocysteine methyltransferase
LKPRTTNTRGVWRGFIRIWALEPTIRGIGPVRTNAKTERPMKEQPLRTTVIGSYPFPGWLEFACQNLDKFGEADREELIEDAVSIAIHDQLEAGLDVITDGEQTRLDFNLSFYGFLEGIELESAPSRRFGPPAHDQRGRHKLTGEIRAPRGLGTVRDFQRLQRLAAIGLGTRGLDRGIALKASVPGPYTLSGRIVPNQRYYDRYWLTEALLPIVREELMELVRAGCREICVDEPSMSCYAHREDPARLVDIFNRTVNPIYRRCRLSTHLCFGNFKGRAVGPRRYAPMFPAFNDLMVDEIHVEMASREFAELEIIGEIAKQKDVAVGIVDVKSYYVETVDDVANRVRTCLKHAPAERLSFAPDCGLSQTARWAAKQKLKNMVEGVKKVRGELKLANA